MQTWPFANWRTHFWPSALQCSCGFKRINISDKTLIIIRKQIRIIELWIYENIRFSLWFLSFPSICTQLGTFTKFHLIFKCFFPGNVLLCLDCFVPFWAGRKTLRSVYKLFFPFVESSKLICLLNWREFHLENFTPF